MEKKKSLVLFIKNEIVLCISFALAVVSALFVHPDKNYISYIDFRTLSILLALMLIMAGLRTLMVFRQVGEALVNRVSTMRGLSIVLIMLCFFFSMLITNDVALITFVPFTVVVLNVAGQTEYMIIVIVLETIAANLGSMATPIGNPQNLYLYSIAGLSMPEFLKLMLPYSIAAFIGLIVLAAVQVKGNKIQTNEVATFDRTKMEKIKIILYIVLFIVELLVVARILNFWIGLIICVAVVLIFDSKSLLKADYSLLLTFICLFIFIGNMKRIPSVSQILQQLVVGNELSTGIIASQVISNVPAAILLSGFTNDYADLIVGTNLGGLGTLIASMASLISFKQYGYISQAKKGKYLLQFTIYNIVFLIIMVLVYYVVKLI